jgi:alanyl-tRNA synthetase
MTLEPTIRLYDYDAYIQTFMAKVLACREEKGYWLVALNRTAFFPEGGGQFADNGTMEEAFVSDAHEREGVVWHTVGRSFEPGEDVRCRIDWERRFDFMQQHSGEHILSGLAHKYYGAANVGFRLGLEFTTIDFDVPLAEEDLLRIEALANQAVWENISLEIAYPSPEELETIPYRSKKALEGKIRIVTIPGYDICACCGTHVRRTGEIGLIKITSFMNYKGGTRLTLLCGKRALLDCQRKVRDVNRVTARLSVKPEELDAAVSRLEQEIADRKILEAGLRRELFDLKAEKLGSGAKICTFEHGLTPEEIARYCLVLTERFTVAAVFSGEGRSWKYAVASKTEDVRPLASALNAACGGRGGGKPELVQGSCAAERAAIETCFAEL